jgi:oligoendopeptidase F
MAKKSGIHIRPENKGKFRAETKTPKGKDIPESKIKKAENSKDPAVRKRATFAENAKGWAKGKKKGK